MKYEALVANHKRRCNPSQKMLDSSRQIYLRDLCNHNILYATNDRFTGDSGVFPVSLERAAPKIGTSRQEQLPAWYVRAFL